VHTEDTCFACCHVGTEEVLEGNMHSLLDRESGEGGGH